MHTVKFLCAFLLEQSEPRGIGTPLSILATEPTTKLVAAGQCSVNGVELCVQLYHIALQTSFFNHES